VECLILTTDADPTSRLYFGDDALALAANADEANTLGIDQARPGPLVDILLRAALAGDAQVIVAEAGLADSPAEGVGALLRY
jgi:hypothetical protein